MPAPRYLSWWASRYFHSSRPLTALGQPSHISSLLILSDTISTSVVNKRPSVSINVIVQDITGHEDEYTLDRNGFQFVHHISQEKEFDDEGRITSGYYTEVEQLLKDM